MRFDYKLATTVLLGTMSAPAAFAQNFDGPYVGVQAGWDLTDVRNPSTELGTLALDDDGQSFTGGAFAGFDRQVAPRVVLGAEAGADIGSDDALKTSGGTGEAIIDPDWSFDLTARAGYLLNPSTLAYVRGGYTNARVKTTMTTPVARLTENENRDGWLAGAGIERQLMQHTSARLEYRYSDLSEGDGAYDRHRVLAGISYRF